MSQAPGLSGTPDSGHCSSAATSASCARSSATPMSPTTRARPAMSLADSIRQTASMASAAVRRVIHHLAHFHFQILRPESDVRFQEFPGPLDRVLLRSDIVDRVAADDLLRLGKRSVRDRDLSIGEPGTRAQRRRRQTTHPDHDALLGRVRTQLHDLLDERRRRVRAGLARLHNRHEFHGYFPARCLFLAIAARCCSSCLRSSGVNSAPKSSDSKIWRISTSPSLNGIRFAHSRASARDFTCQIQNPATSSLASVNGPSRTVRLLPASLIRAPFAEGCNPSPASMTPALTNSSLNFPIPVTSCSLG